MIKYSILIDQNQAFHFACTNIQRVKWWVSTLSWRQVFLIPDKTVNKERFQGFICIHLNNNLHQSWLKTGEKSYPHIGVFTWRPLLILLCVDKALQGLVHPPEYRSSPEQTRSSNNFVSLRSWKTKSTISTVMGLDWVPPGGHLPPSHWSCGQTLLGCHVSLQLSRH